MRSSSPSSSHLWALVARVSLLLVMVLPPAWGAISHVGFTETGSSAKTTSLTLTRPAGLAAGDVMIAAIAQDKSGSWTPPAGWTVVHTSNGTQEPRLVVWRRLAGAAEPATYLFNSDKNEEASGGITAYRGVDGSAPVAASAIQANPAVPGVAISIAPSISPAPINTMLVAVWATENVAITAPGTMTESIGVMAGKGAGAINILSAYQTQAASGATGPRVATLSATNKRSNAVLIALRPLAVTVDHYELSLPSAGLACLGTVVSVFACANSSSPCTSRATTLAGQTATLSTSAGSLGSTSVTFDALGVATTTLSHPSVVNGASVSVTLAGEQTAAANARQCCPNGSSCAAANSCSTLFNTAGLIVSGAANGAVVSIPAQTAGTSSGTYYLRAVQTNTSTKACEAALSGVASVDWAYQCNNPSTCSAGNLMSVTGNSATAVTGNPNSAVSTYAPVPMTFDGNGNAPFSFNYSDVGQVTLFASKAPGGSLLSTLVGGSNAFVVKPAGFTLSNIRCTTYVGGSCATSAIASPGNNPSASTAAGTAFMPAGASFSATVTAVNSAGAATPNYGRETQPEGVELVATLVQPAAGHAPALNNASAFGSFSAGTATGTAFSWDEVGVITLTPHVADRDYLLAGDVVGAASGNIGRFTPARFTLGASTVTHRSSLACSPGSAFTYLGENFRLGFTLTAKSSDGITTTQNYAGSFAKLDPTAANAWNLAGISGSTVFGTAGGSPRLVLAGSTGSWISGVASAVALTATALRGPSADGPFAAAFGIAPADSDAVALASYDLDTDSPANGTDRALVGVVALRHGRLRMQNAYGSELLALPVPLEAQYWASSYYATNTLDNCSVIPMSSIKMGNYLKQLGACETQISPVGNVTLVAGKLPGAGLVLSPPGTNNAGSVDLSLNLTSLAAGTTCVGPIESAATAANMPWFGANPGARAAFGVYKSPILYRRENY